MAFIIIYLVLVSVSQADAISLQDILSYATENAVTLKIKKIDALVESKNVKSAKSGYYPSVNLTYNVEYDKSLDGSSLGSESVGGVTISNGTRYQSSMAIGLNYDLYHFGTVGKQVDVATSVFDVKKMEWCSQEKQLHLQILQKYADALKAMNEQTHRIEMLEARKKIYKMKERLYAAGQYSKIDLGDEAIYVIGVERDVENARMRYKDDIIKISQLSYVKLQNDVELLPISVNKKNIFAKKYNDTTEAQILYKRISQKEDEISLHKREQLPSIGLYGNYYLYASHPTQYDYSLTHLDKKSWNIGLSMRYNVFDGFKSGAKKERLKLELRRLQQELNDAKHNYEHETASKTTRINELDVLRAKEENLLEENYKKRAMLTRLREKQKIDSLTRLNAQYELLQRILNLHNTKIDVAFEKASLNILDRGINQCAQR